MDLKTHIKNHQILWGSGIGFVIFVSFIGGMILVNTKPWESESSSTPPSSSNTSSPSSRSNSEAVTDPVLEEDPSSYQRTSLNGTLTSINSQNKTFEMKLKGVEASAPEQITVNVEADTKIVFRKIKENRSGNDEDSELSFTSLTFDKLRNNDTLILNFNDPIPQYSNPLTPQKIIVTP